MMSGAQGQAAGLAVGAAVGSTFGQPAAGASIGSSVGGAIGGFSSSKAQGKVQRAAIRLNQQAAKTRAADHSARHAASFRQALASQVSLSNIRGGAGSLTAQFGAQAFETFAQDEKAIAVGAELADVQAAISLADLGAKQAASQVTAVGGALTGFEALTFKGK